MTVTEVMNTVRQLDSEDRLLLLERLVSLIRSGQNSTARSIHDLQGLGKEIWQGVDGQAYVDGERTGWVDSLSGKTVGLDNLASTMTNTGR